MASCRIAAYCRVSTDKQDQINSLMAQKQFFQEYVARTGDSLISIYADEGISGTKLRARHAFLHLMQDARQGMFDRVIVKDISRFARNTVDLLQSIRELKALGINTIFLTSNMTSMGDSEFIITLFGAMAQEESANMSKRIKFGKHINAEKGRVPNLVYGFDKVSGNSFALSVNEREAAIVRQIFHWYTAEGIGANRIAQMLNARGAHTKRGGQWTQTGISRLLRNTLYIGRITNGRQEVSDFLTGKRLDKPESEWLITEKPELCIIEPETFLLARRVAACNKQKVRLSHDYNSKKYLFSTLIQCAECGHAFRRITRTYRNTYVRWVCSAHNMQNACGNSFAVDDSALTGALQEYFSSVLRKSQKSACLQYFESDGVSARLQALRFGIRTSERTRRKYMDMYTDGLIDRAELNRKIKGMREAEGRMRQEAELLQSAQAENNNPNGKKDALSCTANLVDVSAMSNAQLRQIVDRIEVSPSGLVDVYIRRFV